MLVVEFWQSWKSRWQLEMITQRLNLGDPGGYALRKWKALHISGAMATFKRSCNEYRFGVNLSAELVEEMINIV